MEGKNNELKIELYPDREPRYDFKKETLKNIIPKDALAYSFNETDELALIRNGVPLLNGFYKAHSNHYPIRIKPDDIWLLIVQAFSHHVNFNSEKLRNMFVNFSGKKELVVSYPLSHIEEVNKKTLEDFSEQINEQMKKYLGDQLLNVLTPNFSTTTYDSSIVCKISIMGAFKKYFDYTMDLCGCGVPYLILEGTAEDYKKIILKAKELSKYKFEWYIKRIIPHIEKMLEAKEGKIDADYFKNMIQSKEETEHKSGPSGYGGYDYKVDHISGWILNFFAYINDGDSYYYYPFKKKELSVLKFKNLAKQKLIVPFKIIDINKKEYFMKYKVGFIGCNQNQNKEVYPVTGWIVSPNNKKSTSGSKYEKYEEDEDEDEDDIQEKDLIHDKVYKDSDSDKSDSSGRN